MISTTQLGLCLALFPLGAMMMACSEADEGDNDFNSSPNTRAYVGQEYMYSITTNSTPEEGPVITGVEVPQWLTLTDNADGTGLLRGVPSPGDIGMHRVELRLDADGRSSTQRFDIEVHSEEFVNVGEDDDFDGEQLREIWRFHDPRGDSSFSIANGSIQIGVPGGVSHDLWKGEENQAPRLLQTVDNANFGIEARFTSVPEQRFQIQGLVAQETDDRFIRLDMHHNGTSLRIYAAYIDGTEARVRVNKAIEGPQPDRLRVLRAGEYWTLQYSADGETWSVADAFSQPLVVRELGLFAGNAAGTTSPAFTAVVDYFRNTDLKEMPEFDLPEDAPVQEPPSMGGAPSDADGQ
jgi:hypothetical protein